MTTPAKVIGFLAALAALFGLALAIGNAVGPIGESPPPAHIEYAHQDDSHT